jgi:hypothetical protein
MRLRGFGLTRANGNTRTEIAIGAGRTSQTRVNVLCSCPLPPVQAQRQHTPGVLPNVQHHHLPPSLPEPFVHVPWLAWGASAMPSAWPCATTSSLFVAGRAPNAHPPRGQIKQRGGRGRIADDGRQVGWDCAEMKAPGIQGTTRARASNGGRSGQAEGDGIGARHGLQVKSHLAPGDERHRPTATMPSTG